MKNGWLTSPMKFLDYGCGNAATGVHFIRALEAGRYTGADLSSGVLMRAREWVAMLQLEEKKPNFVHLPGGSLAPLAGSKFDVVFSQDVVTHMAPDLIVNLVRFAPKILNPGGALFLTYSHCDADIMDVGDQMDWFHNARFFQKATVGTPLDCEEVAEWSGVEYKNQPLNRMVRFSLKPSATEKPRSAPTNRLQ
jgi:SAM-dependent methyltransferase